LRVAGYFVVFFAAMALGGMLFLLGGIGLILIPGSLPVWAEVGYIFLGIAGSVAIALLAADRSFRMTSRRSGTSAAGGQPSTPRWLGWLAGVAGTVLASVLSAVIGAVALNLMNR
jgi:hypothetical protein